MFSTSVVVSLVLAVVFGAAALLLWRSRNHAPSSSDVPDPEPSGQKNPRCIIRQISKVRRSIIFIVSSQNVPLHTPHCLHTV